MSTIFTSKGDDGYTGLLGEGRIAKHSPRIEAIGDIDEATAALGLARSFAKTEQTSRLLMQAQRDLYSLMAEASATPENAPKFRKIDAARVLWLEEQTNQVSEMVPALHDFILPGDTQPGAALSMARTIVRRAERSVAYLLHKGEIENPELLSYLNRLSSLCFVLELLENHSAGFGKTTLAKGD